MPARLRIGCFLWPSRGSGEGGVKNLMLEVAEVNICTLETDFDNII